MAVSNIQPAQKSATHAVVQIREQIDAWLPDLHDISGNRDVSEIVASAKLAIGLSDDLKKCFQTDAGIASIRNALQIAAQTGLSLNPQLGEAALVPRMNNGSQTCLYWTMKNGLKKLAMQSGAVETITCDTVHERDEWSIEKSPDGDKYKFVPARKDRGGIDGYFAAIRLKSGESVVKYVTADEIKAHRASYSSKSFMPEEGYGLKTAIKKLLRDVTLSPEVAAALSVDDDIPRGLENAKRIHGTSADTLGDILEG